MPASQRGELFGDFSSGRVGISRDTLSELAAGCSSLSGYIEPIPREVTAPQVRQRSPQRRTRRAIYRLLHDRFTHDAAAEIVRVLAVARNVGATVPTEHFALCSFAGELFANHYQPEEVETILRLLEHEASRVSASG